jgi:predicted alpha-1,2-mannosidase
MTRVTGLRVVKRVLFVVALALACASPNDDPPPVSISPGTGLAQWVDPFIGTTASAAPSPVPNGAGGSTNPAAALPFGMVQWGPDTPNASPPGYEWTDTTITGSSVTHLSGAGCSAARDFPIFPVSGAWDSSGDASDGFDHARELASPGFYEVKLASGIAVDLTATTRTGFARFTFPHDRDGTILVGGQRVHEGIEVSDAELTLRPDGVVLGHRTNTLFCGTPTGYVVHFAARFDRRPKDAGAYGDGGPAPGARQSSGGGSGLYFDFDASSNGAVQMKVGLSYVSDDAALANLDAESPGWDFDAVHASAIAAWETALGHVEVEGGTDDQKRELYTALYHSLLQPAVASDVDGSFVGFDDQVHQTTDYVRYQNYSGWDVYRSWVQLIAAIAPEHASDVVRSLVEAGAECGVMPRWALANREASTMVGDPADAFVASGYAFGARGFDAKKALSMMVEAATNPAAACQGHVIRPGLADELTRHYLAIDSPTPATGVASTTIEYAVADFAIAQLAAAIGDPTTHTTFMDRAGWWKNVFDATYQTNGFTGYLQPRYDADVSGQPHFKEGDVTTYNPYDITWSSGFVEGNATQYTFAVPHDLPGLIAALGGDAALIARLDPFFTQIDAGLQLPNMYIGNEPNFATPWQYDFVGAPSKTEDVVSRALAETFSAQPSGLPGNDDLGAMSAWQAWAMIGMYPAVPGVSGVVLAGPTFTKTTLTLAGGAQIVITRSGDGPYVQTLALNGAPSTSTWIDWSVLASGATLDFTLGETPSAWGTGPSDRPPAFD